MDYCEMCWRRHGEWALYDDNAEIKLCGSCFRLLEHEGETVEWIDTDA